MKKLIFLTGILFTAATVVAQPINTNLMLAATPPASLSEWGNRKEILTYIISSQPGLNFPVIIKSEIKTTDGTVIGTTDLSKARVFTVSSTTTILYATDVLPLENILFSGKYKTSIQRTGKLPADNYILCVQLVRPVDYTPASASVCKTFYLASTQLPILMKPYNEEVLDGKIAQTAITFRWTPVVPRLTDPVSYRLQVFEVLADQNPMQALRSNQPLLDKEIKGATQFIWQPQLSFMICCKDGDVTGDEKNINTSEAGLGTGKDNKSNQKNINTSEDNLGSGHNKSKTVAPNKDSSNAQKNINTSEAGVGTGKDKKNGQKNINTSEDNLGSGHNKIRYIVKRFIWTIQSLDSQGNPVTRTDSNGEARSEPLIFFVDPNKNNPPQKGN